MNWPNLSTLPRNKWSDLVSSSSFVKNVSASSISLPASLQLKVGQFFAAFGRQNPQHPHTWAFVDQPLVLNRDFGPDGLRNVGAQLSWLAPLPFYTELSLGFLNGEGSTAFSFRNQGYNIDGTNMFAGRPTIDRGLTGLGSFLYVPRLSMSFDLTPQQTLVAGISGTFGPNDTGPTTYSEIYGADLYWKWKSPNANQRFPFVSWQSEFLWRNFDTGAYPAGNLPAQAIQDYGFYTQVLWGFQPRWVAGLRGEWVNGNDAPTGPNDVFRGERVRVSPVLTFYPSEFSKIRLQYNYDRGQQFGTDNSVWVQMEFLLGAHGAHKF